MAMLISMFQRFSHWLPYIIVFVVGIGWGLSIKDIEIVRLKREFLVQQNDVLKTQLQLTSRLTRELVAARNEIDLKQQQLERSINDAIQNDAPTFNGLGANSFRLYQRAFGYDVSDSASGANTETRQASAAN